MVVPLYEVIGDTAVKIGRGRVGYGLQTSDKAGVLILGYILGRILLANRSPHRSIKENGCPVCFFNLMFASTTSIDGGLLKGLSSNSSFQ